MGMIRRFAVLAAGALLFALPAAAQQTPPPAPAQQAPPSGQPASGARLRVYLDCDCFQTYLRDEIDWVDYVRQPQDADVHILGRTSTTGGGGREFLLRFIGRNRFEGVDQELKAITLTGDPEDTERRAVLQAVTVGLLGLMARAGLPGGLDVAVRSREAAAAARPARDPWNLWVFEIEGSGSYEAQESSRERNWDINVSADRVSENWKVSFGANADQNVERFDLDEDDPFESRRRERSFDGFVAKSFGRHWSLGVDGRTASSTFGNTRFSARVAPAVEFSVFPYEDYATRQLVLQYEAGVERAEYNEVTLFDKVEETLYRHEFSVRLDQRQPWGSLEAGAEVSQYLHDASKYRVEVRGEIDLRIARGLSLRFDGSASRIRDQLSLPKRNASPEEVLLRLRELQSGYEVDFSFGISYSFGSLFNNVVNPRFGG